MTLSSEQQVVIMENTVKSVMKEFVIPAIQAEVRDHIREAAYDCLKYLYAEEIRQQVLGIVTTSFLNKLDIQVTMKD